jgi:hypothetical protein
MNLEHLTFEHFMVIYWMCGVMALIPVLFFLIDGNSKGHLTTRQAINYFVLSIPFSGLIAIGICLLAIGWLVIAYIKNE